VLSQPEASRWYVLFPVAASGRRRASEGLPNCLSMVYRLFQSGRFIRISLRNHCSNWISHPSTCGGSHRDRPDSSRVNDSTEICSVNRARSFSIASATRSSGQRTVQCKSATRSSQPEPSYQLQTLARAAPDHRGWNTIESTNADSAPTSHGRRRQPFDEPNHFLLGNFEKHAPKFITL